MSIETLERVAETNGADAPTVDTPAVIPGDYQDQVDTLIAEYRTKMEESWTPLALRRMQDDTSDVTARASSPVLANGYQYWNCYTAGPFQFFGNPPYRPGKIIAHNEFALMLGVIWINPANGPGGSLPGSEVLAHRRFRASFETINLSDVTNGPNFHTSGQFADPSSNLLTIVPFVIPTRDPGPRPNLYETSFTVDVVESGLSLAAFSTWHYDTDYEPPFLGIPEVGPRLQHDQPARYMVYRK